MCLVYDGLTRLTALPNNSSIPVPFMADTTIKSFIPKSNAFCLAFTLILAFSEGSKSFYHQANKVIKMQIGKVT